MNISDLTTIGYTVSRGVPLEYAERLYAEQTDLNDKVLKNDEPIIVRTRWKKEKVNGAWTHVLTPSGAKIKKSVAYVPFTDKDGVKYVYCTTSRKIVNLLDVLGYTESGDIELTGECTLTAKCVIEGDIVIVYVEQAYGDKKYLVPSLTSAE